MSIKLELYSLFSTNFSGFPFNLSVKTPFFYGRCKKATPTPFSISGIKARKNFLQLFFQQLNTALMDRIHITLIG